MTSPPKELNQVQRWMQSVITHPQGVAAGVSSDEARRILEVPLNEIESVILPSKSLDSVGRLHVYANAYYARLLECLREEFPALTHALGRDAFDGLAMAYLQAHPSQSYTLGDLSRKFPDFLAETAPQGDADEINGPTWIDFLIDLARLEYAYSVVFDGPGTEGRKLLDATAIAAIPQDRWEDATLQTVPCLRLMQFRYPVHEFATLVKRNESPAPPEPNETFLVITRRDFIVRRQAVEPAAFTMLRCLKQGFTLGDSLRCVVDNGTIELDELLPRLSRWFQMWTSSGYFETVRLAS